MGGIADISSNLVKLESSPLASVSTRVLTVILTPFLPLLT